MSDKNTNSNKALRLSLCTDASELNGLSAEWNKLLKNSDNNNIFMTWEWQSTWWKHFGRRYSLFLIIVRNEYEDLVGIAPFKIAKRLGARVVEFIGYKGSSVCPEYLDIIAKREYHKSVRECLIEYLATELSDCWDVIHLTDIPEFSLTRQFLSATKSHYKLQLYEERGQMCPYAQLPPSYELYVKSRGSNMRRNMRRFRRELTKRYNITRLICNTPEEVSKSIECLQLLHNLRRKEKDKKESLRDESYYLFHKELALKMLTQGWLYLTVMFDKSRPIACYYGYIYDNTYYAYQTGFDPAYAKSSAGFVLHTYVIEDIINLNIKTYDMLRGEHEYKYRWADKETYTFDVWLANRNLKSTALLNAIKAKKKTKKLLKSFFKSQKGLTLI